MLSLYANGFFFGFKVVTPCFVTCQYALQELFALIDVVHLMLQAEALSLFLVVFSQHVGHSLATHFTVFKVMEDNLLYRTNRNVELICQVMDASSVICLNHAVNVCNQTINHNFVCLTGM